METYLLLRLKPQLLTPEAFQPFGQVIFATEDGKVYDQEDAHLQLQNGTPRFYIMRLSQRAMKFDRITRHRHCTQCLGSLEGKEWFMAVARPGEVADLDWEDIHAFRIPGNCFIKLHVGTWHAGPYFEPDSVDFYSLELSDTNIVDHDTCHLMERYGVECELVL